jgi:hypothetical protein
VKGTIQTAKELIKNPKETIGRAWKGLKSIFSKGGKETVEAAAKTEKVIVKKGTSVLGHYPEYTELAAELGARRFKIPTEIWNKMTAAEQWAANQKFLDRLILRGDNIRLATPLNKVKPGSFFQKELDYLFQKGYKISDDGLWLIK